MHGSRTIGAALIMGALLLGCKGDDKEEQDQALTIERAAAEAADILCQGLVSCACTDASALEDCRVAHTEAFVEQLSISQVSFPGRILDPVGARACLDEFRALTGECRGVPSDRMAGLISKAKPSFGPRFCEDMDGFFVGTQSEGEPCNASEECLPALACNDRTQTCSPRGTLGAPCYDVDCADGLVCLSGYCREDLPAVGEACPNQQCREGAVCRYVADPGEYQCLARHALGEECADDLPCVEGTFCCTDDAFCPEATDRCLAQLPAGAACQSSGQCASEWCNAYDGKCFDPGFCSVVRDD